MSDELTIQPQVQRTNPMPYALGGAAVGGTGAYFINQALKKPMSHEDIIKEVKDTTDFSTKGEEKATWEGVKEKAKTVADLEEKLKNVPEKTLPDSSKELDALNKAKEARQKEFERLYDIEKNKSTGRTVTSFPSEKVLKEELSAKEFSMLEPYVNNYKSAREKLLGKPGAKYVGGTVETASRKIDSERAAAKTFFNAGKNIDNEVNKVLPKVKEVKKLVKYADYKRLQDMYGEDLVTILTEKPDEPKKYIEKTGPDGKKRWIQVDTDVLKSERDALRNQLKDDIDRTKELNKQLKSFDKDFLKANESALKNDMTVEIKSEADLAKLKLPKEYKPIFADIEEAELKIKNGRIKFPVTIGGKTYTEDALREFKIQLEAEREMAVQYTKEKAVITNELKAIQNNHPNVKYARQQFQKQIAEDKGVKDVLDTIERRFNGKGASDEKKAIYEKLQGLMNTEEVASLSDSEITEKVNKSLEGSSFEKNIKSAQTAYDKALETKGVSNTAAKEAVEKELATAKDKLKTAAEDLGKKYTKGGINKWLAAGIGAAVGAAALFGYASSKNS